MKLTAAQIAEICHEANRAYCRQLGDDSQMAWGDAPDWQRKSAINGVKFRMKNPDALSSESHENWLKEKVAEGWKYGKVKDAVKKTHPCVRPYAKLPQDQRRKDVLFIAIVDVFTGGLSGPTGITG
jgi:hypothetical protein